MTKDFYQKLLSQSPMGYAYHKMIFDQAGRPVDYEFLEVNSAFEELTGLIGRDIIGKRVSSVVPDILSDSIDWISYYGEVALHGLKRETEQFSRPFGKWYRINAFSTETGYFATYFTDITKEKEQLEELNGFFDVNLDLLCIADVEGNFLKVNKAWETTLGYKTEELVNRRFLDFVHPEDLQATIEELKQLGHRQSSFNFVNRYCTKDGSYRYIEWRSRPEGKRIYAAARDITEKIKLEETLQAEKIRNDLAMAGSNDGFWDWNIETKELYLSPRWKAQLGYLDEEIPNEYQSFKNLLYEGDQERVMAQVHRYLEGKEDTYDISFRMVHKEGSLRHIRARGTALRDEQGKPYRMAGSHTDVTIQVEQEKALKEKERNFNSFFETIDDILLVGDSKGNILFANRATVDKLGYLQEELHYMHILDLHPKDKRTEAEEIFSDMFSGKRDNCPLPLITKDGKRLPVETRVWFGTWNNEDCVFGVVKDLSAQEAALDKFHKLFNNNPALMAISNMEDHRFKEVNEAFCERLGYQKSEIIGKTVAELGLFTEPEKQLEVAQMLQQKGRIRNIELKVKGKSGQIMTGLFSGEVIDNQLERSFLTVMTDITERKIMEDEIRMLTEIDRLTRLHNRYKIDTVLKTECDRSRRTNSSFSIILFDIDDFKKVNDRYGHVVGDEVLKEFADIIRSTIRKTDMAGRWGGEEFLIILPDSDSLAGEILAEKLRVTIDGHDFVQVGHLTGSFGVAEFKKEISEIELLARADDAMYQAKKSGKNQVCRYEYKDLSDLLTK